MPHAHSPNRTPAPATRALLAAAAFASLYPLTPTRASDHYFVGLTNSTWTSANTAIWSTSNGGAGGAPVPGTNDNAFLFAPTASKTLHLGTSNTAITTLASVQLDGTSSFSMTLNHASAFNLYTDELFVGLAGRATYSQSAGTVVFSDHLYLGTSSSGTGTYLLSGGTLFASGNAFSSIGRASSGGTGSFIQTGGTHAGHSSYQVHIADFGNSSGYYSLSGTGLLDVRYLNVGGGGIGTFVQTGGTVGRPSSPGDNRLSVGNTIAPGTSTYSLSAGTVAVDWLSVADNGNGAFNQSGGTVTGTSANPVNISVASNPNTNGAYSLSAGRVIAQQITVGESGGGQGSFTQTGGTVSSTWVNLGFLGASTSGSWTIDNPAAVLTTQNLRAAYDGTGSLTLSAGSVTVSSELTIGAGASGSGSIVLQGGAFHFAPTSVGTAYVGEDGKALMGATAGTINFGSPGVPSPLVIGHNAGSNGTFIQVGGTTNAYGPVKIADAGGTGTLAVYGGAVNIAGTLTAGAAPGANATVQLFGGTLSAASYTINGALDFAGGTLTGPANTRLTNYGTVRGVVQPGVTAAPNFSVPLDNFGTLTANPGATLTTVAGIYNYNSIQLPAGTTLAAAGPGLVNDGAASLAGGTLTGPGPLLNNGSISGAGTIAGTGGFTNNASVTVAGGNLTLANTSNTNLGTIAVSQGWQLRLQQTLMNQGLLELNGGAVNSLGGAYVGNLVTGVISGKGSILGSLVNNGSIHLTGGPLTVTSPFSSTGSIHLSAQTASLTGGALFNAGTLHGLGLVSNNLNNVGTIRASAPGGVLTLAGTVSNQSAGLLAATPGATLLLLQGLTNSSPNLGTISLTGGTLDTNNLPLVNNKHITGHGTLTTSLLTNNATITLTGGPTTINGPVLNQPAQSLKILHNPATFTGPVTNNGTLAILNTTAVFAQGLTGNAPSAPSGVDSSPDSSFILQPSSFLPSGSLTLDPTSHATANFVRQDAVDSAGSIAIRPSSQGGSTSSVNSLTLTGSGTFDLADTRLIVSATPAATIRSYLLAGLLSSSTADNDPQHRLAIAYALASDLNVSSWGGLDASPSSLLTKLTYQGDANLDGILNQDDFALLDKGLATNGQFWWQGDFNYDGSVTPADYLLLDRNYTLQSGTYSPSPALLSLRAAQFGPQYVSALLTSIPEPSTLACLFACSLLAHGRRRRPSHSRTT